MLDAEAIAKTLEQLPKGEYEALGAVALSRAISAKRLADAAEHLAISLKRIADQIEGSSEKLGIRDLISIISDNSGV